MILLNKIHCSRAHHHANWMFWRDDHLILEQLPVTEEACGHCYCLNIQQSGPQNAAVLPYKTKQKNMDENNADLCNCNKFKLTFMLLVTDTWLYKLPIKK